MRKVTVCTVRTVSAVGKAIKYIVCAQSGYSSLRRSSKQVLPKHIPEWLPSEISGTVTEAVQ